MILSLATSVMTLTGMWLVSKKRWQGWAVGLANQVLWLALIFQTKAWGLLLLAAALVWIYSRALVTWRREAREVETDITLTTVAGTITTADIGKTVTGRGIPKGWRIRGVRHRP